MADSVNIGQMTLSRYFNNNPKKLKPHEKEGERDGKRNKPDQGSDNWSGYEQQLIATAKNKWSQYQQHKKQQITQIEGRVKAEEDKRDEGYVQNVSILENEKEEELTRFTNNEGPQSPKQTQFNRDHDNTIEAKKKLQILLNRPLQTKIVNVYLPFMIILACLESPLNALAFELFFKDTLLFSYGIALALGTILIYFAHVGGEKIKETTCKELKQSKASRYILVVVLSLFSFIVIWFLAQMREEYLAMINAGDDSDILGILEADGIGSVITDRVFKFDLGIDGYLLLIGNLAIYLVGLLASYMRHDSHPDYEKAHKDEEKAKNIRDNQERKYTKEYNDIQKKYDDQINFKSRELNNIEEEIGKFRDREKRIKESEESDLKVLLTGVQSEIVAYQKGNESTRTDPNPLYFNSLKVSRDDIISD